ncbi:MAG: hypothetical protein MUQ25_16655, partial [Candidatus Aminicenantes bacterium]|nr:hypothetical protein [Candidatus Aminicenantes bacterium]
GEQGLRNAISHFRAALDIDPLMAVGYAGLAAAHHFLASNFYLPPQVAEPLAKAAALRALDLDESLAEAHAVLGCVLAHFERDYGEAENEFKRAIAISPRYAAAHHWYSFFLILRGRPEEAIREIGMARDLDPLSSRIRPNVGCILILAGRCDEAAEDLAMVLRTDPSNAMALAYYSEVLAVRGQYGEAVEEARKAIAMGGEDMWVELLVAFYQARWGKGEEAERLMAEIASRYPYVSTVLSAAIYGALGDLDRAFALLEKAIQERDYDVNWLRSAPEIIQLSGDPRFSALLKKYGLDQ